MAFAEEILDFEPEIKKLEDASKGKRFLNAIIDFIAIMLLNVALGVFLAVFGFNDFLIALEENPLLEYFIGVLANFVYYVSFEGFTNGKSLGKILTKTRVVTADGQTPSLINIIGRTLCRYIPFDALSFLGKETGWHDSISHTKVVLD